MQVVILAAGRGKGMKDLTSAFPKSMLKIKGKPILEHKVNALPKEIKEVIFVVGYYGEHIMNHFKKSFNGRKITYIFQPALNGTGGALFLAKSFLKERFMVMMGDDLYRKRDIKNLLKYEMAVLGHEVDDPSGFGMIKTNRSGNMIDIVEKPKKFKEKLANTGLYVMTKKIFDYDLVPIGAGEFGLPQTLAKMADKHKIKVEKASFWHPISNPKDLEEAENIIHKLV